MTQIKSKNFELLDLIEFNKQFKDLQYSFSFFHINIVSLNKNGNSLKIFIDSIVVKFDLLLLTEIRNLNLPYFHSLFSDYNFFYNKSLEIKTGGAAIYIKKNYISSVRDDLSFSSAVNTESIFIEIKHNKRNQVVGCVYRHPSSNFEPFKTEFLSIIDKVKGENKDLWIIGDFNINLLNTSVNDKYIFDFHLNNCKQLLKHPTRIQNNSATLIDHIYSLSFHPFSYYCGCIDNDFSDHKALFLLLPNFNIMKKNDRPIIRIYSQKNLDTFTKKLSEPKYDCQFQNDLIQSTNSFENEEKWNKFMQLIQHDFDHCFPLRRVSQSKIGDKIWITKELKRKCKQKCKLYKNFKLNGNLSNKNKYLLYKRMLEKEIYQAKADYYSKYLASDKNNKKLWKHIKFSK